MTKQQLEMLEHLLYNCHSQDINKQKALAHLFVEESTGYCYLTDGTTMVRIKGMPEQLNGFPKAPVAGSVMERFIEVFNTELDGEHILVSNIKSLTELKKAYTAAKKQNSERPEITLTTNHVRDINPYSNDDSASVRFNPFLVVRAWMCVGASANIYLPYNKPGTLNRADALYIWEVKNNIDAIVYPIERVE